MWGTNSSIFLNIGDTFGPWAFLGVVSKIKNENFFENILPSLPGVWKIGPPPLYGKIILGGCLIGQMKRFDALITR